MVTFVSQKSALGLESNQVFRRALRDGAVSAMAGTERVQKHLFLTGSITKLDRRRIGSRMHLACEVNVVVIERVGGKMQAVLSGRATSLTNYPRSQDEEKKLMVRVIKLATQTAVEQLKTNSII